MDIQETRLARAFMEGIDSRRYETGVSSFRRFAGIYLNYSEYRKTEIICGLQTSLSEKNRH